MKSVVLISVQTCVNLINKKTVEKQARLFDPMKRRKAANEAR